jgi:hypothetical protein
MALVEFPEGSGGATLLVQMKTEDMPEGLLGRPVLITCIGTAFRIQPLDWEGTAGLITFEVRSIDSIKPAKEAPHA